MAERDDSTDHIDWDILAEERLGQRPRAVKAPVAETKSDAIEEIRCALAMRDAGYAVLFDHETSAELLRRYDIAVEALKIAREAIWNGGDTVLAISKIDSVLADVSEAKDSSDAQ